MLFKRTLFYLLSLLLVLPGLAQQPAASVPKSLDSLEVFLHTQPVDTLYALAMKDCAFQYIINGEYDQADSLRKQLEKLRASLHHVRINYYVPFIQATLAYHQNDSRECLAYFLQAMQVAEANPSVFKPQTLESAYNNVAAGYGRIDKPDSMMYYALQAIHVQDRHHFKEASAYMSVANVLHRYKKYAQALVYYKKGLTIDQEENDIRGMAIVENKLGVLYDDMGKTKQAIAYYLKGLAHAERANYPLLQTDLLVNLGLGLVKEKQYAKAEAYFKRGEALSRELENYGALRVNLHNQGELYRELKKFDAAEKCYLEALALAKKEMDHDELYTSNQALAELYMDTRNFEKACTFLQVAAVSKDSIFKAETANKMQDMLLTYETEKKQQEIALLNQQNLVQKLQLSVKRRNEILLLFGIGIFGLAGGMGYRHYRRRSQLEMEKVRSSIAADFHDELGANLSSIALYSDILIRNTSVEPAKTAPLLENINHNARQTISAINDLIWTIKPDNDVLERTLVRMKEFAIPLMEAKHIAFDFQITESLQQAELDMTTRKILYLLFKEAINNALKYAEASQVTVQLTQSDGKIHLVVTDNGKGFDIQSVRLGNGLGNMQKRAAEINGLFTIDTQPGKGCTLRLSFKAS
jgi:signal transduction histidine kinase